MSRVSITVDVNRYLCSELSEMRGMIRVLDFSGLAASIERVQHHATAMEEALEVNSSKVRRIRELLEKKKSKTNQDKKVQAILDGVSPW